MFLTKLIASKVFFRSASKFRGIDFCFSLLDCLARLPEVNTCNWFGDFGNLEIKSKVYEVWEVGLRALSSEERTSLRS